MIAPSERLAPMQRVSLGALFLLAVALRCLPFPIVFANGRIQLLSFDAYYHLRRIRYILSDAATPLEIDPYLAFPRGAKAIWPGFLDNGLAWLLGPFVGPENPERMVEILVWLPPLLGASTVLLVWALARRTFGLRVAWVAGLLAAILPAQVFYSRLSFIDHHVATAFCSTLLLAAAMAQLERFGEQTRAAFPPAPRDAWLGVLIALVLLVWPGSILEIAVVEGAMVIALTSLPTRSQSSSFAARLAIQNAIALLLILPFTLFESWPQWGTFSPVVLSRFQPWLFLNLSFFFTACAALWRRPTGGDSPRRRAAQALGLGVLFLALNAIAFPEVLGASRDAWEWIARDEVFQGSVAESEPILYHARQFTTRVAVEHFSYAFFLFPLALLAFAWSLRNRSDVAPQRLLVAWALVFALATLAQRRFENTASIAYALILAWALIAGGSELQTRLRSARMRSLAAGAIAVACLSLLAPSLNSYGASLGPAYRALRGQRVPSSLERDLSSLQHELALWLRDHTPETDGLYDASIQPDYGIYAPWGLGHMIEFLGERPVVLSNFGDDIGRDHFSYAMDLKKLEADAALERLEELSVRYVVIRRERARGPLQAQLFRDSPQALTRFRLVFESTPRRHVTREIYKVFEVVEAAQVSGLANPGAPVQAEISLRTNRGRRESFATSTTADTFGRYELLLPYATLGAPPSVIPDESYTLISGEQRATLRVPEDSVLRGLEVEGPDLREQKREGGARESTRRQGLSGAPSPRH